MMSAPPSHSPLLHCLSFGLFDRGEPNVNLIWSDVWQGWVSERGWGPGFFFFGVGWVELRWGRMRVERGEEEEERVG